jgi:hypothetical protein
LQLSYSTALLAACIAIACAGDVSLAQEPNKQPQGAPASARLALPSDEQLIALVTSTLIALNQANATGNYSVFRELTAPGFQVVNSSKQLAETFAELRSRNFDLSPIVLLQPKLLREPEIGANGMLRITGFFPTSPEQLNFDLVYQPVNGLWLLFGIATNTTPVGSSAASGEPQASLAPDASKPKSGASTSPKSGTAAAGR